jgi:hypothetical protein
MWNGITIVKNDENHDELKFLNEKNYIGKISMHLIIKSTFFIFYVWQT